MPGAAAPAVAAAGAIECEGVARDDAHRDWLDSAPGRRAGREEGCAARLGGDEDVCAKATEYCGVATMEARRALEPATDDPEGSGSDLCSDCSEEEA